MAKQQPINSVSPDVLRSMMARIEQLERRVLGGLQPGDETIQQAPDDVIVLTPVGGIAARAK